MIRNEKEYIRLPGSGFSLRTRARLYMGRDHLLSLLNTGYTESYKRFYFKDIQAVVFQKTVDGIMWSISFSIVTVLWILIALIIDDPVLSFVFGWIPASVFLILFLGNQLSGPTCVSYIYTAVTKEKLRSLSRLKHAHSVINTLRPFIDSAQGNLTSEEIRIKATQVQGKSIPEIKPRVVSREERKAVSHYNGRYHEIFFYMLFLFGVQDFMKFILNHGAITFLGWILFLALGILGIVSIVKQHTSAMKKEGWLVGITWATLVYLFVYFNVSYFIIMYSFLKNPELIQHELEIVQAFFHIMPLNNIYIMIFYIISMVYAFTTVALGLILLRRYKHGIERHR